MDIHDRILEFEMAGSITDSARAVMGRELDRLGLEAAREIDAINFARVKELRNRLTAIPAAGGKIETMGYKLDEREIPLDVMSIETFTGLLASLDRLECRHSGSDGELRQWHVKLEGSLDLGYITALPIGKVLQVKFYREVWDNPYVDTEGLSKSLPLVMVRKVGAALAKLKVAAPDAPALPTSGAALDNGQDKEESTESVLAVEYRAKLRRNLAKHFSKDDLRTLCFDLGIEHENLPETKDGMARGLVEHCERTGRVPELVEKCKGLRPKVAWEDKPE